MLFTRARALFFHSIGGTRARVRLHLKSRRRRRRLCGDTLSAFIFLEALPSFFISLFFVVALPVTPSTR